jgi:HPt (histidine-containing phosphotransfer) domain-containing protein
MTDAGRFDLAVLDNLEKQLGAPVVAEIIGAFLGHAPGKMSSVRGGCRSGDLDAAARALHSIRSSAGMLGARGLFAAANEMEILARSGDHNALVGRLGDLEEIYGLSEAFLTEQRARMAPDER